LSKIWAEFGLYGEVGISANHGPMICWYSDFAIYRQI
jgi:hypothetical protein